ncbi:hypothetical protein D082_15080 [Synechocystis sp. PCC 6714]|nr:hypothetical protein D082_15080 [Synechocystis sp. PCC 6714]
MARFLKLEVPDVSNQTNKQKKLYTIPLGILLLTTFFRILFSQLQ